MSFLKIRYLKNNIFGNFRIIAIFAEILKIKEQGTKVPYFIAEKWFKRKESKNWLRII